jgi:hypothetical protein
MFGLRVHQGNAQSPSGLAQIFSSLSKSRHNKNVHFRLILFLHANTKERRRRLLMDVLHLMKEKKGKAILPRINCSTTTPQMRCSIS